MVTGQEQENRLPLYPHSLQINFKYSFTVKYIGLLRQVFSPFQSLHCEFKNILYRAYVNSLSPVMSGCPSFTHSCLFPILPSFLTGYNFLLFRLHSSKIYPGSILDSLCQVRICLQSLFNKPKRQDIIMNDTPPYR